MSRFVKKGIHRAQGQFIYPEPPRQGRAGNCAAYAAATCLYAYGADHAEALIPRVHSVNRDPLSRLDKALRKMVEELQEDIYSPAPGEPWGVEAGILRYLQARDLAANFVVSHFSGDGYALDFDTSGMTPAQLAALKVERSSNFTYMLDLLEECQDVIAHVTWEPEPGKPRDRWPRHAITLTGFDRDAGEVFAADPWGSTDDPVPAARAGIATLTGADPTAAHTRLRWHRIGDEVILVDRNVDTGVLPRSSFNGHPAWIYGFTMVCPNPDAPPPGEAVLEEEPKKKKEEDDKLKEQGKEGPSDKEQEGRKRRGDKGRDLKGERFSYSLKNDRLREINGLALPLVGAELADLVALQAPPGWSVGPWFLEEDHDFFASPPEQPGAMKGFAGVLWRAEGRGVRPGERLDGFAVVLRAADPQARLAPLLGSLESALGAGLARLARELGEELVGGPTWEAAPMPGFLIDRSALSTRSTCVALPAPRKASEVPGALDALLRALAKGRSEALPRRAGPPEPVEPEGADEPTAPEAPGDAAPSRAGLDPTLIEGVDEGYRARLAEQGLHSLGDLAALDPEARRVRGVSKARLTRWVDMARLLLRWEQLSPNDAELLVVGLGVREPGQEVSEERLRAAMGRVKLPEGYDPSRVRAFLRGAG